MIAIVRLQSSSAREKLWNHILAHKDEWQRELEGQGLLLYLTRRAGFDEVSLFVHVVEPDDLGRFVLRHLSRSPDVQGLWLLPLLEPVFFPVPRDTHDMHRYTVTLRTEPARLLAARDSVCKMPYPEGVKMAYCAYTLSQFDESIYYSVLAQNEWLMDHHADRVRALPEVQSATVQAIERTVPLLSFSRWMEYSSEQLIVPNWDEANMLGQFQT